VDEVVRSLHVAFPLVEEGVFPGGLGLHLEVEVQGYAQGVKARAQVGQGGGDIEAGKGLHKSRPSIPGLSLGLDKKKKPYFRGGGAKMKLVYLLMLLLLGSWADVDPLD
jgi:hypothetical protein